jgi:outer membrane protein insertion porin family
MVYMRNFIAAVLLSLLVLLSVSPLTATNGETDGVQAGGTGVAGSETTGMDQKTIAEVNYEGVFQHDVSSIRNVVETEEGEPFSYEQLNQDLHALYSLDLFDDIQVDVEEAEEGEGLIVTFLFTEHPTIREIIIRGNRKVRDRVIKDTILLRENAVFRRMNALADLQSIEELYEEKGRPDTTITYRVVPVVREDPETGTMVRKVDVVFEVEESRKLVVLSISFSGNEAIDSDRLTRTMETRRRGDWFNPGYFSETEFELDKSKIEGLYANEGYVDAQVVKVDRDVSLNERKRRHEMDLVIYIEEGDRYTFGGVDITGNKIFTEEEMYEQIQLDEGDVYDQGAWERSVQGVRDLLASNGYIYFDMGLDESKDEEQDVISYDLFVREGSKAHVENIYITGNDKTKDFVIERELQINEGEIFSSSKIQRSREKLFALQYFSTVGVDVKPGSELGLVDLIFDVEEQKTGLFSFGLTYSTAGYGISFFEEVSARNFLGRGLRLYERVSIGFTSQQVEVGLDEPWLFGTPTSAGFTLSYSRTEYGEATGDDVYTYNDGQTAVTPDGEIEIPDGAVYDPVDDVIDYTNAETMDYVNTNYKAALRLGRRFGGDYGVNSELAFSVFRNRSGSGDVPFEENLRDQFEQGYPWLWKNYLSITGYRDTRDIPWFATRGSYLSQNIKFYGGFLGGYSKFIELNTDANINVETFGKWVLSARLNFGFIVPNFGESLVIDDSDYLRIDTWNEGRGWQHPSQFQSLYAERGRAEFNMSIEYRYPVVERFLWLLTFFDISGLYDTPEDFSLDAKDLYYSFGFGASVVIPGFPIRLYLARRFAYDETLDRYQFAGGQRLFEDWDFVFAVGGFF